MTESPLDPATSTSLSEALLSGRLAALVPAIRRSMYTSVLSITVFSILLARFNPIGIGIWLVIRAAVSAVCLVGVGRLDRANYGAERKIRFLALIMGVSGVVWGSIPAFVRPEASEWRAVVILWLFGNQAVVTAVSSPARPVFLAAIGSVTVVGAAAIGIGGGSFGLVLAALLVLGGLYSVAIFASLHRTVETAIAARWEASCLAASLAERQAELESTNEELAELASHDGLTGLLNRRAFTETVTGGSRTETLGGAGWIGFVDIDHFKSINDTHGHRAGDEVLVALARRWSTVLDDDVVLARAGGDEFIVTFPALADGYAENVARQILATLADPVSTDAGMISVACSIGLAEYRDGEPLTAALGRADQSLYAVKRSGRNAWAVAPWDAAEPHEGVRSAVIGQGDNRKIEPGRAAKKS